MGLNCSGIEALVQEQINLSIVAGIPPSHSDKMSPVERTAALAYAQYLREKMLPDMPE